MFYESTLNAVSNSHGRLPERCPTASWGWLIGAFGLMLATWGCGGPSGPKLDNSAESFVEAQQALAEGDSARAMELLTASIEARPDAWAYFQRAQLYVAEDNDTAARADCKAGLELDPENANLVWLSGELKKPTASRFKGKFAKPPSESK